MLVISNQEFSSPDGPIITITNSVEGNSDNWFFFSVRIISQTGCDMGVVMLNWMGRDPRFFASI